MKDFIENEIKELAARMELLRANPENIVVEKWALSQTEYVETLKKQNGYVESI